MSLVIRSRRKRPATYTGRSRSTARLVISLVVLLLIFVAAGVTYTWWIGRSQPVKITDSPVSEPVANAPLTLPDNAPVGVSMQSLTSPVRPGDNASMTIKTNPKAACSIKVEYTNDQPSSDSGLVPKNADEYGIVTWSWQVEANRLPGIWPATVTCANAENSGVYVGKFEVKNE